MSSARSKKAQQRRKVRPSPPASTCRDLVLVDSRPLRTKIWRQYQTALRKFEKFTAELHQFKYTDSERYRLWYEGEFAREIIQLHQSRAAVAELTDWMEQIEAYAEYRNVSLATSLRHLKEARDAGRLDELWEDIVKEIEESDGKSNRKYSEREWQDFEEDFDDLFEEATDEFYQFHSDSQPAKRHAPAHDEEAVKRLRRIYHQLALRLHPDTNPEQSQEQRQLFLQMQEAYREQDLETLEGIWTKLEGKGEEIFSWKTAAISEIISRKKSLDQRSRDLGTELKYARHHPAWEFSKNLENRSALSTLKQKVRRALKSELAEIDAIWEELNEQLQQVERQSQRAGKRKAKVNPRIP